MKSIEKEGVEGLNFIWKKNLKGGLNFDTILYCCCCCCGCGGAAAASTTTVVATDDDDDDDDCY